ncbi:MAG: hypothetical protein ACYSWU_15155 [Planctomycetota bacterium]|jgi:hypothetical protein
MIVMPSNNNAMRVGWLAGRFPGKLGHLYSPGGLRGPYDFMPFGLDNGRFVCWQNNVDWDGEAFMGMLHRVQNSGLSPRFVLVPDVVASRDATLREWDAWWPKLDQFGWPLAFAAQDGMKVADVPREAKVIFVGGSTEWKRATLHDWCEAFDRVHIGRINTPKWLWECHRAGAESCDGTGWLRGDPAQWKGLVDYLEATAEGLGERQGVLSFDRICNNCHRIIRASYAECPTCHGGR